MIPPVQVAEIRRLFFAEHWRVGTIASQLGVHSDTVRGALGTDRLAPPARPPPRQPAPPLRPRPRRPAHGPLRTARAPPAQPARPLPALPPGDPPALSPAA